MRSQHRRTDWRILARFRSFEPASLVLFGVLAGGVFLFQYLVGEVLEGEPLKFDTAILLALRQEDSLAVPIGPSWLLHAADDITSLGGVTVLSLLTVLTTIYLVVIRKIGLALYVSLAVSSGWAISTILKVAIGRPRPDLVPHLVQVSDLSFPSGHAMLSAVTFLTLGALLAKGRPRPERIFLMGCAIFLAVAIGLSRIYLGVHYPSDVVGGWCMGTVWALLCWFVAGRFTSSEPRPIGALPGEEESNRK